MRTSKSDRWATLIEAERTEARNPRRHAPELFVASRELFVRVSLGLAISAFVVPVAIGVVSVAAALVGDGIQVVARLLSR